MNAENYNADAREQFEAWARTTYTINRESDGRYCNVHTEDAWHAWQAALAARPPGAQAPVAEIAMSDDGYKIGLLGPLRAHRLPLGTKLYTAPPAQGIDLGQLRKLADRWERTANDKDVAFKDRELIGMYDKGLMKCVRELRAALIDQRDAAPGVGE